MPKMVVVPVMKSNGKGEKTYVGERLVNVYDRQRIGSDGNVYCVAKEIPEGAVLLEWEQYLKISKTRGMM